MAGITLKSIHFNETSCWNECEKELACNSNSLFYSEQLYYGDNCLLYTNESPETIKTKTFVSKMRKPKGSLIFVYFISTKLD